MSTITVGFSNNGVPATGLAPTIRIRRTDTQALVVTDAAMTEQGDGAYSYEFAPVDGLDYSIRADGTATLPDAERYAYGGLSGTTEARIETDVPAILADTDALDTRLTAGRATNLDEITSARLAELDPANLPADVDTLAARLTPGRALLLDNLSSLDALVSSRGTANAGDAMTLTPAERAALDAVLSVAHGAGSWAGVFGVTAQDVRDAMKLAPSAGAPVAGSVDDSLDVIEADTSTIEPIISANLDAAVSTRGTANVGDAMALTPAAVTAIDAELSAEHGAGAWTGGGSGLTAQETRDAMKLAPSAGAPAAGSIDAELDAIETSSATLVTRTVNLDAALAFFGAVLGTPVTHTPTLVSAGGFTWSVALAGPNVTFTRLT